MTAAQDLFWLAHYTYNTLNPLVEEAKAIEPSVQFGIETTFGHEAAAFNKAHKVKVELHWSRDGMLAQSWSLKTKAEVDQFALLLRTKVIDLKAEAQRPLEAGIPA